MGRGGRAIRASGVGGVVSFYANRAVDDPDRRALAGAGSALTYGQIAECLEGDASPGSRVVIDGPPGERWAIDLLSALAAGREVVLPDSDWTGEARRATLAALGPPGDEAGVWLFTSGTTARPRPYFRSDGDLAAMVARVRARLPSDLAASRPTVLGLAPLDHGYGLVNGLFLPHALGGTALLPPADPAPALIGREVRMLYAWPRQLRELVRKGIPRLPALRWCVSSSFGLDPATAAAFTERTGCAVRQQYGTTELGPLCVDAEEPPRPEEGCVGRPLPGVEVEVRDGAGRQLPPGVEGELAIRVAPASDWWPTGDLGTRDGAGRVRVLGRLRPFTDERGTPDD